MSRRRTTNWRCWKAASEFYAGLLRHCDTMLRLERDPAALLAGIKIRDDLRQAMREAVRNMHRNGGRSVPIVGSEPQKEPAVEAGHGWPAPCENAGDAQRATSEALA